MFGNKSAGRALDIGAPAFQAFVLFMNKMFRVIFLIVCACAIFGARTFAAETNSVSSSERRTDAAQNAANGYLQIQEQLHDTRLAIENSRQEAAGRTRSAPPTT